MDNLLDRQRQRSACPGWPTTGSVDSTAPRTGLALLPFYLFSFWAKAGLKPVGNTVDLTHGKTPVPHDSGYASRTYLFSESETDRILDKARALDLSLQQYMCLVIAEAMFSTQPDKSRVHVGPHRPGSLFARFAPHGARQLHRHDGCAIAARSPTALADCPAIRLAAPGDRLLVDPARRRVLPGAGAEPSGY